MTITTETQRNGRIYDALEAWQGIGQLQDNLPALVPKITVKSEDDLVAVVLENTLQLEAEIQPASLAYKGVTWSIISGTGAATISENGLLTAGSYGAVTARATANDESGVSGSLLVTIVDHKR